MIGIPGWARDTSQTARERDRFDRRARHTAAARAETRRARRRVDRQTHHRVDQREPGRARVERRARDLDEIGDVRRQLREHRRRASERVDDRVRRFPGRLGRVREHVGARFDVGTREIHLDRDDAVARRPSTRAPRLSKSATVRPQIDAMTRAPRASSAGRSCAIHASTPGPGKPDRVDHPAAGRFRDAQRRIAFRREDRDRLRRHRADARADRRAPRPPRRARTCPTRRRSGSAAATARARRRGRPRTDAAASAHRPLTPRTGAGRRRDTPATSAPRRRARPPRRCRPPPPSPPRPW